MRLFLLLAACAATAGPLYAQGRGRPPPGKQAQPQQQQLDQLRACLHELRDLSKNSPGGIPRRTDQVRILQRIAQIDHPRTAPILVGFARDPAYAPVLEELLRILAGVPNGDEALIGALMHEHLAHDQPARRIAREYLLRLASRVHRPNESWLLDLFERGTAEDRFLVLRALCDIKSVHVLETAWALLRDRSWEPSEDGLASCGTIAASLRHAEGESAARLLLLLVRDPRFTPADVGKMREATRFWKQTNLRAFVDLGKLGHREPVAERRDLALFLGAVGFESARSPLLQIATDRGEPPEMRAAAATALGGLTISPGALAADLTPLLRDPDAVVRAGALEGLTRLRVRQAAEAIVEMASGSHGEEARATLARVTGGAPDTDWASWLATGCAWPEGT